MAEYLDSNIPRNTLEVQGGVVFDSLNPKIFLTVSPDWVDSFTPKLTLFNQSGVTVNSDIPKITLSTRDGVFASLDSVISAHTLEMLGGNNGQAALSVLQNQLNIQSGGVISGNRPIVAIDAFGSIMGRGTMAGNVPLSALSIQALLGSVGGLSSDLLLSSLSISGWLSTKGSLAANTPLLALGIEELAALVKAILMNTDNFAISEYEQFDIDSVAQVGDIILLAGKDGLYVLTGSTDDGTAISANVRTILTDFDSPNLKTITDGYFAVRGNGGLDVATVFDDGSLSNAERITAESQIKNHKTEFARGTRNRFAGLDIKNVAGSDFEIDEVGMMIEVGSRRVQ